MTFRGHIKGGVVVLDGAVELPEGAEVEVILRTDSRAREEEAAPILASEPEGDGHASAAPTLFEELRDVIGKIHNLPADFALNHDHYIHGLPKK